jgi:hypothetical protein
MEIVEEKKVIDTTEENKETKKVRKPREKVRSAEECFDLPVSKLTDKEKDNLIKELKESLTLAVNQAEAYKKNAESAFAQTNQIKEQYKSMENYYKEKLRYVDLQVQAFTTSVNQAIRGGVE